MQKSLDSVLSSISVRLKNPRTRASIGSGFLYTKIHWDHVYVVTAAHCLYEDSDSFKEPLASILVDVLRSGSAGYETIPVNIDHALISPSKAVDIGILKLDRATVEEIVEKIPTYEAVKNRSESSRFVCKGFPMATRGRELAAIAPTFLQNLPDSQMFQMTLHEDYMEGHVKGFSGSPIFLLEDDAFYLYGMFVRYRPEERGKVIYAQFVDDINTLLTRAYLPTISFTFIGNHGLNFNFFAQHLESAVANLGPRFNEKLNLKMPIARLFSTLVCDMLFRQRVTKAIDKFLRADDLKTFRDDLIDKLITNLDSVNEALKSWVDSQTWSPTHRIDFSTEKSMIDELFLNLEKTESIFHDKWRTTIERKEGHRTLPFQRELHAIQNTTSSCLELLSSLKTINLSLANNPILIIKGSAGCGKSHLLGDIANECIKNGIPSVLLLGQLFRKEQSAWSNVTSLLNFGGTKNLLLDDLNSIGEQLGHRLLIMVDALNEGGGKDIWSNELHGFITDVRRYPFLALVMTIRDTYFDFVIPESLKHANGFTIYEHEGFSGNEYEALRLFCEHYNLEQPSFPILNPEFTNPLFLRLICEGIRASGQTKFPTGHQSISHVFSFYQKAVFRNISKKREGYRTRTNIVGEAMKEFALATSESGVRMVNLEDIRSLFERKFANYRYLLDDLIFEGVFIQNPIYNLESGVIEEIVYFSYERYGDFVIATELLAEHTNKTSIINDFGKGGKLVWLADVGSDGNAGILEALAVILPELYSIEIFEVLGWLFEHPHGFVRATARSVLGRSFLKSLKWRQVDFVDQHKAGEFFNDEDNSPDFDSIMTLLMELSVIEGHPFNSDQFSAILESKTMPERDAFLLPYLKRACANDQTPILRLIDWAWTPRLSAKISDETARLASQCLAWLLSSSDNVLRDRATKSLVNLLEAKIPMLLWMMRRFESVDDQYIQERIYAVAYGCALRSGDSPGLRDLANYVYATIFKGTIPRHILTRDYARNIVEYALYKDVGVRASREKIRPPYGSQMPKKIPTEASLEKLNRGKTPTGRVDGINSIYSSVFKGDFGIYVIGSACRNLDVVSFTAEEKRLNFIVSLTPQQQEIYELFEEAYLSWKESEHKAVEDVNGDNSEAGDLSGLSKAFLSTTTRLLYKVFSDNERAIVKRIMIPLLDDYFRAQSVGYNFFDERPIKRWIVGRVLELGYDPALHAEFDRSIPYNGRHENAFERVGKKYQWIAFHEIMGTLFDNFNIKLSHSGKTKLYEGPWHLYLRDIDPAFVTRDTEVDEDEEPDDLQIIAPESAWWRDNSYAYWNRPDAEWVHDRNDLPSIPLLLKRKDPETIEWIFLEFSQTWRQPRPLGQERYGGTYKEIYYQASAYLIRKNQKRRCVDWCSQNDWWNGRLDPSDLPTGLFVGENFWSPASKSLLGESPWYGIKGTNLRFADSTIGAVGEMSGDKSGAHHNFRMPSKDIFEYLSLRYGGTEGVFLNASDDVIVTNLAPSNVAIRAKEFRQFLRDFNLDIVWGVKIVKRAIAPDDSHTVSLNGAYYFDGNWKIKGTLFNRPIRN